MKHKIKIIIISNDDISTPVSSRSYSQGSCIGKAFRRCVLASVPAISHSETKNCQYSKQVKSEKIYISKGSSAAFESAFERHLPSVAPFMVRQTVALKNGMGQRNNI